MEELAKQRETLLGLAELRSPHFWHSLARQSREIEGITYGVEDAGDRLRKFVFGELTPGSVRNFCFAEANATLRDRPGADVMIGGRLCPPGGLGIQAKFITLIKEAAKPNASLWGTHASFLWLHPFTDGNGRTARAIFLWQALRRSPVYARRLDAIPLLQVLYYESLSWYDSVQGKLEQG